jgi:hypothetical protein
LKSSSAICGFASGPRWPLDIVVPNKHTITIPIKERIVRLGFFVFIFVSLPAWFISGEVYVGNHSTRNSSPPESSNYYSETVA